MSGSHVSGRALADELGVSEMAVRKAVKAGRITRESDGLFDLDKCRAEWPKNTDPGRSKLRTSTPKVRTPAAKVRTGSHPGGSQSPPLIPPVTNPIEAAEAIALVARILQEEGVIPEGPVDYSAARLAETILKARERDLKIAERRKLLVPSITVQRHFSTAFVGFRRAFQGMAARHASETAAKLGCNAGELHAEIDRMVAETLGDMSMSIEGIGKVDHGVPFDLSPARGSKP